MAFCYSSKSVPKWTGVLGFVAFVFAIVNTFRLFCSLHDIMQTKTMENSAKPKLEPEVTHAIAVPYRNRTTYNDPGMGNLLLPGGQGELVQVPHETPTATSSVALANSATTNFSHGVLPRRLITVFGLESSGTRFLAQALSNAIGAKGEPGFASLTFRNYSSQTEVQHVSLPWGWFQKGKRQRIPTIVVIPPLECSSWPPHIVQRAKGFRPVARNAPPDMHCLNETGFNKRMEMPPRFMLNITSHIGWYRQRGVNATAVVLVRDDYAHFHGKQRHVDNREMASQEDLEAKRIIVDAMRVLDDSELVIASYETLMSLQGPYLQDLYNRLGIRSSFLPEFKNGNEKYIIPLGTDKMAQQQAAPDRNEKEKLTI